MCPNFPFSMRQKYQRILARERGVDIVRDTEENRRREGRRE
jgi:hypothetical protein